MNAERLVLVDECTRLQRILQHENEKFQGPLDKLAANGTSLPFILFIGNHSSGKSSFINYLLNRKIQITGVAPTDDSFTIIMPGKEDSDKDGPTVIDDPDFGFAGLSQFGPALINKTLLKIRKSTPITDFMLVDSPGMIDSPVMRDMDGNRMFLQSMDRGYDFEGVCRWYAERADVILLFFDPDKPGTTSETLSILTTSLVNLDHKLHIILNKADQFHIIHDFARAYGALCWNLSKVIQRKDLPRIHTLCLPSNLLPVRQRRLIDSAEVTAVGSDNIVDVNGNPIAFSASVTCAVDSDDLAHNARLFFDLDASRDEVIKEIFSAPKRRVDHEISRLSHNLSELMMHCRVIGVALSMYDDFVWKCRAMLGLAATTTIGLMTGVASAMIQDHPSAAAQQHLRTVSITEAPPNGLATVNVLSTTSPVSTNAPLSINLAPDVVGGIGGAGLASAGSKVASKACAVVDKVVDKATTVATRAAEKSVEVVNLVVASNASNAGGAAGGVGADAGGMVVAAAPSVWSRIVWAVWPASRPLTPPNAPNTLIQHNGWSTRFVLFSLALGSAAVCGGVYLFNTYAVEKFVEKMKTEEFFGSIFEKLYASDVSDRNESVLTTWSNVLHRLKTRFFIADVATMPRVRDSDLENLRTILDTDVARLRRQAMAIDQMPLSIPSFQGAPTSSPYINRTASPTTSRTLSSEVNQIRGQELVGSLPATTTKGRTHLSHQSSSSPEPEHELIAVATTTILTPERIPPTKAGTDSNISNSQPVVVPVAEATERISPTSEDTGDTSVEQMPTASTNSKGEVSLPGVTQDVPTVSNSANPAQTVEQ